MAGTIKGMTIEIGGNTEPLEQALKSTNKEIKNTQNELKDVNKALKLDPSNIDLLKQKQQLLGQQIGQTTTKIDALKQAQKQMEAEMKKGGEVNQEDYRKLQREIAKAEVSLKDLKEEAKHCHPYLQQIGEALSKVGKVAGSIAKESLAFTTQGVKMLGTTALACSTSVFALAQKSGALADDLNTLASTTGLSTKELQEFQYASDLIDVSVDTLSGALKKTTSAMNSAKDGTGSSAEAFKKLGVEIKNADGSFRDNNDVFQESIKALGKIGNETERDAIAMQLFGKSATELNPLIEGGIDSLAEMSKQANELGLILSQEALDGANAFNDELDILKANGKGLFNVLGTEIASMLTPAMKELNETTMTWIKEVTTGLQDASKSTRPMQEIAKVFTNIVGNMLTKVTEALPKIAEFGIEIVKTLIHSIRENAETIGWSAGELMTTLVEGLYDILPSLVDTGIQVFTSFVQTIAGKLPELIPSVVDKLINGEDGFIDSIINNLDKIIEGGVELIFGLGQGLETGLPKLIAQVPVLLEKFVTIMIEELPTIVEAVGEIIIAVANTLGESVDTLVPVLIDTIFALVDVIIDNLPTILETIINVVLAIADALIDNIEVIIDAGVKLILGLGEGLIKALPKLLEKAPQIIMTLVNGLLDLTIKVVEVGWRLIEALAKGLVELLTPLGNAIQDVWKYVSEKFNKAFEGMKSIGQNIIEGLWNGMKNAKDWLIGKIKQLCNDALRSN